MPDQSVENFAISRNREFHFPVTGISGLDVLAHLACKNSYRATGQQDHFAE
jgi:hypothetical protein